MSASSRAIISGMLSSFFFFKPGFVTLIAVDILFCKDFCSCWYDADFLKSDLTE